MDEIVRVVDALQLSARSSVATPANWPNNHENIGAKGWAFLLPTVTPEARTLTTCPTLPVPVTNRSALPPPATLDDRQHPQPRLSMYGNSAWKFCKPAIAAAWQKDVRQARPR